MKSYKIKITYNITATVTEEDWNQAIEESNFHRPFDEYGAIDYVKNLLIERIENDPNSGHIKILSKNN